MPPAQHGSAAATVCSPAPDPNQYALCSLFSVSSSCMAFPPFLSPSLPPLFTSSSSSIPTFLHDVHPQPSFPVLPPPPPPPPPFPHLPPRLTSSPSLTRLYVLLHGLWPPPMPRLALAAPPQHLRTARALWARRSSRPA